MASLPKRLLSAALAVGLLFGTRGLFGADGLFAGTGLIVILGLIEFSNFFSPEIRRDLYFRVLFATVGTVIFCSSYFSTTSLMAAFWCSCLFLLVYLLLKVKQDSDRDVAFRAQCLSVLGLFYCALSPALTARVLTLPNGAEWFLTMLAVIFFGDSFAFFAGYTMGNRKLAPLISPKKTWAGAVGGIVGSILFGWLFTVWFLQDVSFWLIASVAVVTGIFAQLGDLFESLSKRVAGVKDSGKIMPGHGGILDRIDGVLFGGPIFYYLIKTLHFSS